MRILALDPGGTTGWAYLNDSKLLKYGTVPEAEFDDWIVAFLKDNTTHVVVCEDFIKRPFHKSGQWDKQDTSKLIGVARLASKLFGCEFVLQQPSEKVPGYGLAGLEYKKGKAGMHKEDALAHGMLFWHKKGKFIERERLEQEANRP